MIVSSKMFENIMYTWANKICQHSESLIILIILLLILVLLSSSSSLLRTDNQKSCKSGYEINSYRDLSDSLGRQVQFQNGVRKKTCMYLEQSCLDKTPRKAPCLKCCKGSWFYWLQKGWAIELFPVIATIANILSQILLYQINKALMFTLYCPRGLPLTKIISR